MKNNGPLKKYLYKSLAGAGSIIICILVFFAMYRFDQIVAAYNLMKGILMPFIYGAVIAYLLTPVCNFIERHLFCFLESRMKKPEKAHGIAGGGRHRPQHGVQSAGDLSPDCHGYAAGIFKHRQHRDGVPVHG